MPIAVAFFLNDKDLELELMTLIYESDLDILKAHLHTKNEISM